MITITIQLRNQSFSMVNQPNSSINIAIAAVSKGQQKIPFMTRTSHCYMRWEILSSSLPDILKFEKTTFGCGHHQPSFYPCQLGSV